MKIFIPELEEALSKFLSEHVEESKKEEYKDLIEQIRNCFKKETGEYIKRKKMTSMIKRGNFQNDLNCFLDTYYGIMLIDGFRSKKNEDDYRIGTLAKIWYHQFKNINGDNVMEYYVGVKGPISRNFARASIIREIISKKPVPEIFLSWLTPDFVRNGQYTVIPFPFKYLREYAASTVKIIK